MSSGSFVRRPFVCRVPRPNSRKERPSKSKIGTIEVDHMSNPWTYLEVKRSKVKVTRLINAHTVNAQYCRIRSFGLLHHFQHRSRHVNQANHANPFLTYFHFRFPSKSMQIHRTHLVLFCYTVIYRCWPTHVEIPIFHSAIWYLSYANSDQFETLTIG